MNDSAARDLVRIFERFVRLYELQTLNRLIDEGATNPVLQVRKTDLERKLWMRGRTL